MSFIFAAMQKIKMATANMPGEYASALVYSVPPNLLCLLLSETGGNKSAILSFMIDALDKYTSLMNYEGLHVTDFTLEALRGAMADNDGTCLVHMHEGKKLCSIDQYKGKGGDSTEVLMEALVCRRHSGPHRGTHPGHRALGPPAHRPRRRHAALAAGMPPSPSPSPSLCCA